MAKIGIDIREATERHSGKSWYTWHLVRELLRLDTKNQYLLYARTLAPHFAQLGNAEIKIIPARSVLWHRAVARDWQRENGDLFFAPTSYIIPALLSKKYRSIITVHDLIAFLAPGYHQLKATLVEKLFLKRALKKTRHVLAPSENTKRDLHRFFSYPLDHITVTPLGVDTVFFDEPEKAEEIKKKFGLSSHFILGVAGLEPRKNMSTLIDAFLKICRHHGDLKLVIVGGDGWKSAKTLKKIAAAHDSIIRIKKCSQEELANLYHRATVFVFPSFYEGFGLPPLEALASGCPVICSDRSALREVCGEACMYIHPESTESIAAAIEKMLSDSALRHSLKKQGILQAKKFTWRATAEKTLEALQNLL